GYAGERGGHAVGILLEAADRYTALHAHTVHRKLVAKDRLGGILRNRDEAERHIAGQREIELGDPLSVDVDDLATHQHRGVEDAPQYAHPFEHLECPWLHANGFLVLQRLHERVDDAACDAT